MTTVVCNRAMMAADSMLVGDCKSAVKKVWKFRGNCIGIAGEYRRCVQFIDWYKGKTREEPRMKNVDALVLTKDGRILHYEGSLIPYEVEDNFSAIGSGSQAALAAMHMGADPRCAIVVASKVDAYTGGRIQTIRIRSNNNG